MLRGNGGEHLSELDLPTRLSKMELRFELMKPEEKFAALDHRLHQAERGTSLLLDHSTSGIQLMQEINNRLRTVERLVWIAVGGVTVSIGVMTFGLNILSKYIKF